MPRAARKVDVARGVLDVRDVFAAETGCSATCDLCLGVRGDGESTGRSACETGLDAVCVGLLLRTGGGESSSGVCAGDTGRLAEGKAIDVVEPRFVDELDGLKRSGYGDLETRAPIAALACVLYCRNLNISSTVSAPGTLHAPQAVQRQARPSGMTADIVPGQRVGSGPSSRQPLPSMPLPALRIVPSTAQTRRASVLLSPPGA